jgi:hypothetical protein
MRQFSTFCWIVYWSISILYKFTHTYEGESNENLKNVINIRFPAPLFCKLAVQLPML